MLKINSATQFKRDLKKFKYNYSVITELDNVVRMLVKKKVLPDKYRDHSLSGKWKLYRECHLKPDTLLIYRIEEVENLLNLERLGSHAELFM